MGHKIMALNIDWDRLIEANQAVPRDQIRAVVDGIEVGRMENIRLSTIRPSDVEIRGLYEHIHEFNWHDLVGQRSRDLIERIDDDGVLILTMDDLTGPAQGVEEPGLQHLRVGPRATYQASKIVLIDRHGRRKVLKDRISGREVPYFELSEEAESFRDRCRRYVREGFEALGVADEMLELPKEFCGYWIEPQNQGTRNTCFFCDGELTIISEANKIGGPSYKVCKECDRK